MSINGWKYYNHAMIPTGSPDEEVDTSSIENGEIWRDSSGEVPLLARWTSDWDCGYETNWWYCIKDTPLDISSLKAKRRYEINKGNKNFEVKRIEPADFAEELYSVQVAAFSAYPEKYRPKVDHDSFVKSVKSWKAIIYGSFYRENDELAGYALLNEKSRWIEFSVLKTKPQYERYAVNAAIINKIISDYNMSLANGTVICDGARSINHETYFQDYLEKYFKFRKAYCKLHIEYNSKIKWSIPLLYSMRKMLLKFDGIGFVHQINAVLKMEEIVRS